MKEREEGAFCDRCLQRTPAKSLNRDNLCPFCAPGGEEVVFEGDKRG